MSEEIQQALSDLQHMHRLAARTRRWKRAAKYERRGRMFWHKHYYILRGHYRDAQELSERRTQQAAWLERCFGAATRRWREERQRADAAEARAKTWKHAARKMRSYKRAHRDWTEKTAIRI